MRTFQYSDAKSHKFWTIDVQGTAFTVTYGKVGSAGQVQTKTFPTAPKARAEADKLIAEKTRKGYVELTPKAVLSDREALEAAVRADPDDRAAHAALADYLLEHGDPRGEFIQVQLALEDEPLPRDRRKELKAREKALLKNHLNEWVGAWAKVPGAAAEGEDWRSPPKGWKPYRFTRGLLTGLEFGELNYAVARAVAEAGTLGFVRELVVHGFAFRSDEDDRAIDAAMDDDDDFDADPVVEADIPDSEGEVPARSVMLRWPFLPQVRAFRLGGEEPAEYEDRCPNSCHMPGDVIADLARRMPHLEELHVMAHFREEADKLVALRMPDLRVLLLYHGWNYPLDRLARNPSLTNLRELYCHPHALSFGHEPYICLAHLRAVCRSKYLTRLTHLQLRLSDVGDAGVEEVIRSGLLRRLQVLDLRHGTVTDEGAQALAASPDLKHLDRLDLAWNRIGPGGQAALRKTGVNVHLFHQQAPDADVSDLLAYGDIE
jgi:uncharacterized protein (TIGR02996 family)